jgi:hypothetical protein
MNHEGNGEIYYKIVSETPTSQIRLVVNIFNEVEYIHLREYYLDFDGEWLPTSKGFSTKLDISIVQNLFEGLAEIMSLAESREVIEELFGDVIRNVYFE